MAQVSTGGDEILQKNQEQEEGIDENDSSEEAITKICADNNNDNNNNNNKVEGKGGKGVAHSTRHLRLGNEVYSGRP